MTLISDDGYYTFVAPYEPVIDSERTRFVLNRRTGLSAQDKANTEGKGNAKRILTTEPDADRTTFGTTHT